jgi:hypothetical protein
VTLTPASDFKLLLKFTLTNNGTEPIDGVTLKLRIFEDDNATPFVDDLTTPDLKGDIPPGQQREIVHDVGTLYWFVAGKAKAQTRPKMLTPVVKLHEVELLNGNLIRADMNTAPILERANAALDKNHLDFQTGAVEINIRSEYPGVSSGYARMVNHAQFINQYLSPADQLKSLPGGAEMDKLLEIAKRLQGN